MIAAELGYMAGIIDGEGHISWLARDRNVRVAVTSTTMEVLEWLGDRAGGFVHEKVSKQRFGRKPVYDWTVSGERAAIVLRAVLPYLVIKRQIAEDALARWESKECVRPGRHAANAERQRISMRALGWEVA